MKNISLVFYVLMALMLDGIVRGFNFPIAFLGIALIGFEAYTKYLNLKQTQDLESSFDAKLNKLDELIRDRIASIETKVNASGIMRKL